LRVILAGVVLASSAGNASAGGRTAILGYICTKYESARLVALDQGWKSPESMPGDCRVLIGRGLEGRIAAVFDIIDILAIENGRWVEIGAVRGTPIGTGYSAGMSRQLLLF
jgi:hypothetical protein